MQTINQILEIIRNYIASLDWPFILTFMVLSYGINHYKIKEGLETLIKRPIRTRYLVVVTGLAYAILIYVIRDYTLHKIENLLQSFVFALVFHKLLVESLLYWLARHGMPKNVARHFFDFDQLKKLYRP